MKMTEKEYYKLMAEFESMESKTDIGYKQETEKALEDIKKRYSKCVVNSITNSKYVTR